MAPKRGSDFNLGMERGPLLSIVSWGRDYTRLVHSLWLRVEHGDMMYWTSLEDTG